MVSHRGSRKPIDVREHQFDPDRLKIVCIEIPSQRDGGEWEKPNARPASS